MRAIIRTVEDGGISIRRPQVTFVVLNIVSIEESLEFVTEIDGAMVDLLVPNVFRNGINGGTRHAEGAKPFCHANPESKRSGAQREEFALMNLITSDRHTLGGKAKSKCT